MSFAPYLDPAPSPLPSPRLPTLADIDRRRAELLAWRAGEAPAQSGAAAASSDDPQDADNWPALSPSALYGLAGEVIRVIGPHSEADPAAILMQFLAAFGNLIGPGPHCVVESTNHSLNLFVVLVGESEAIAATRYIFPLTQRSNWQRRRIFVLGLACRVPSWRYSLSFAKSDAPTVALVRSIIVLVRDAPPWSDGQNTRSN